MPYKRFIVAVLLALIVSGCALYRRYEASKPETVRKTEEMLSDAGFTTIKVVTDDQGGLVEDLPPYEIREYSAQYGAVYWYYDPDICVCVFEGHQSDYDRYQMAQRQESDTAQYAAQSNDEQVASLNALNGAIFPSADILDRWNRSRTALWWRRWRRIMADISAAGMVGGGHGWRWPRRRTPLAGRMIAPHYMGAEVCCMQATRPIDAHLCNHDLHRRIFTVPG